MLALKYTFMSFLAGLLVTACAHRDAYDSMLRQQIVGTWSQGAFAETTFLPDGRFHSDVKRAAGDARIEGTWDVNRGSLVISTKHVSESYKPGATRMESVSGSAYPAFHKVLAVDGTHLEVLTEDPQKGSQTNLWARMQ